MRKVLIAIDGSEHALRAVRYAADLCRTGNAPEIHLLNVQPKPVLWQTHGMEEEIAEQHLKARGEQQAAAACELLGDLAVPYTLHITLGEPAQGIADSARQLDCDAIVMGRRGLGSIAGLMLGSVAAKVLHLSDLPVVSVK